MTYQAKTNSFSYQRMQCYTIVWMKKALVLKSHEMIKERYPTFCCYSLQCHVCEIDE